MLPLDLIRTPALLLVLLVVSLPAIAQDPVPAPPVEETAMATGDAVPSADIVTWLSEQGIYSQLVAALERTGLDATLASEGPFTVFAPTDDAFAALPEGTLEAMTAEELAEVLRTHVAEGALMASDLGASVTTLSGASIPVDEATIGTASVLRADVTATNGVIHTIDAVLLPTE